MSNKYSNKDNTKKYTGKLRNYNSKKMKGEKEIKTINASKPNELWKIDFKIVDVDEVGYYLLLITYDHSRFILYAKIT